MCRILFIGAVGGAVTLSWFHTKKFGVSAEDVGKIPRSFRKKLVILHLVLLGSLGVFLTFFALWQSGLLFSDIFR